MRVIWSAKASSEPPRFSATTTATSLADFVTSAWIASSTSIVSPGSRPSFDGAWRGGVGGDPQRRLEGDPAALELLEQEIERHHLGDGGGMAQRVLVLGVQDAAGLGVDHHGGVGRAVGGAAVRLRRAASAGLDRATTIDTKDRRPRPGRSARTRRRTLRKHHPTVPIAGLDPDAARGLAGRARRHSRDGKSDAVTGR